MSQSATRLIAPRHQRGIASILIIILIGLVLIVTVIGVFRTVRGAQEQTLAAHARIPAEATAWQGAEAIRRYLHNVDPKMLKYWIDNPPSAGTPIALDLTGEGAQDSSGAVNLEASIVKVEKELPLDADDTGYLATAMITGKAGAGRVAASAPIEVVYRFRVKNEEGPGGAIMGPIFKGLKLKGNPRFPPNTDLNVLGDVEMSEINSTGTVNVRDINATGGVVINSAVSIRQHPLQRRHRVDAGRQRDVDRDSRRRHRQRRRFAGPDPRGRRRHLQMVAGAAGGDRRQPGRRRALPELLPAERIGAGGQHLHRHGLREEGRDLAFVRRGHRTPVRRRRPQALSRRIAPLRRRHPTSPAPSI